MKVADPRGIDPLAREATIGETTYIERAIGLTLLFVIGAGSIYVLHPFFDAILLALPLAISTWPVFRGVQYLIGGRRNWAAVMMTLLVTAILVVPLVALGLNIADDMARLSDAVRSASARGLPPPDWLGRLPMVGHEAERAWMQVTEQGEGLRPALTPYLAQIRIWALRQAASLMAGTLQVVLAVILLFFLYRDGASAERRLEEIVERIGGRKARHVLISAGTTVKSVVNGVVGTALVQGVLLGFSFWLAGVPGAFALGACAVVLAFVPFGLALLWLPACLWLASNGQTGWAIYLFAWNGLFVGSLDNILRPYVIARGTTLPPVLILLGVLGGIAGFGVVGVFVGPVLLAVAYTLLEGWGAASGKEGKVSVLGIEN